MVYSSEKKHSSPPKVISIWGKNCGSSPKIKNSYEKNLMYVLFLLEEYKFFHRDKILSPRIS